MTLKASIGFSNALQGREAGRLAMRQAVEAAGRTPPVMGWVIASYAFSLAEVMAGAQELLGALPLLGFSSAGEITPPGRSKRSVVVGLLCGEDMQARGGWFPDFTQDSQSAIQNMLHTLQPDAQRGDSLLFAVDGFNGDYDLLAEMLSATGVNSAGCLASGELWRGRTYQGGGTQAGSGGLAGVVLGGNVVMGAGAAHGWQSVGALARLSRVQGVWVRSLDDRPASETYARLFGAPDRDWSHAPLADLARQYPLGVEAGENYRIFSPLRVEVDGSLRMSVPLPEGETASILIGSADGCRAAAELAARRALEALGPTHPRLAVLLIDQAWQDLLETDPALESEAVQAVLGPDVPLIGGYTVGQLGGGAAGSLTLLNQHILVVLFGIKNEEVGSLFT